MLPSLASILIGVLTFSAARLLVQTTNEGQEQFVVERAERDVECASCGKDITGSVNNSTVNSVNCSISNNINCSTVNSVNCSLANSVNCSTENSVNCSTVNSVKCSTVNIVNNSTVDRVNNSTVNSSGNHMRKHSRGELTACTDSEGDETSNFTIWWSPSVIEINKRYHVHVEIIPVRNFSAGFFCLTLGVEGIDEPFIDNYCDIPVDKNMLDFHIPWPLNKGVKWPPHIEQFPYTFTEETTYFPLVSGNFTVRAVLKDNTQQVFLCAKGVLHIEIEECPEED